MQVFKRKNATSCSKGTYGKNCFCLILKCQAKCLVEWTGTGAIMPSKQTNP